MNPIIHKLPLTKGEILEIAWQMVLTDNYSVPDICDTAGLDIPIVRAMRYLKDGLTDIIGEETVESKSWKDIENSIQKLVA